jgi:hypothetical protein
MEGWANGDSQEDGKGSMGHSEARCLLTEEVKWLKSKEELYP